MATEGAKAFIYKLQEDKELQERLSRVQAETREALVHAMAEVATDAGFQISGEELAAWVKDESEVTDAQLDQVVGGLVSLSSLPTNTIPIMPATDEGASTPTSSHAYTVTGTYDADGETYVVLRNPWGSA